MKFRILTLILILFIGCKNNSNKNIEDNVDNSIEYSVDDNDEEIEDEESEDEESEESENEDDTNNENEFIDKKITDGTYDASVDYYNPKTGYSATYDLEVEVEDGEVVRINFPKGGWLDDDVHPSESRLRSEEIDEYGEATMEDYNGRTFKVKINN